MQAAHEKVVEAQFGPRARAYVESAVHATGEDLEALEAIVRQRRPTRALDLGTGGHVAYLLARHAAAVTAADLSAEMLAAVAAAERLPFADGSFDFLACRYSAHHWRDFEGGLREARRVLAAGAPAVFVDAYAAGAALLDTHLQAIELLRDTSHVRNRTAGEWLAALGRAGFALHACRTWRLRMDFPVWIARMRTPALHAHAIRALQDAAAAETRAHFAIEPDGSFLLDVLMVETVAT